MAAGRSRGAARVAAAYRSYLRKLLRIGVLDSLALELGDRSPKRREVGCLKRSVEGSVVGLEGNVEEDKLGEFVGNEGLGSKGSLLRGR